MSEFVYQPLYKVSEVAEILETNPNYVNELINTGQLPCLKLGSRKVRGTDLKNFIEGYPVMETRGKN